MGGKHSTDVVSIFSLITLSSYPGEEHCRSVTFLLQLFTLSSIKIPKNDRRSRNRQYCTCIYFDLSLQKRLKIGIVINFVETLLFNFLEDKLWK